MVKNNIGISAEKYYVDKLETYCYKLRDAMINMSLTFPEISTFEKYFMELKDYDNVAYIVGLLHKCWCFAYPNYLFDSVPKETSFEEALEKALSKYQPGSTRYGTGVLKEELNKKNNPLLMAYYRAYKKAGEMTICYRDYMEELYYPTAKMCSAFNIKLNSNFIIDSYIHTEHTLQQLEDTFNVFAEDFCCCDPTEYNKKIFLSIFDNTISAPEGTIMWSDIGTRSRLHGIASIHTIFSTLGIQMNKHNRTIIAKHIVWEQGAIREDQIKARKDKKQEDLRNKILSVLDAKKE